MHPSDPIAERIARLSPAQRAQLEQLLRAKGLYLDSVSQAENARAGLPSCAPEPARNAAEPALAMDFSFMFFADDRSNRPADQYNLLLEATRFADEHEMRAIWIPERHFHSFGGPYPNPSVLAAALATITRRVDIRAGSVVLPLHNPIRVAEEWAMVDNLTRGRVGIAFASGWHEQDFALAPGNYQNRKQIMLEAISSVRALWRGETIRVPSVGADPIEVRTWPRPVQKELPVWITSAGSVETFIAAGRIGANILTALTGQRVEELAAKISAYKQALQDAGYDGSHGAVTLMLHTFVGDDEAQVKQLVREPMRQYLHNNLNLHLQLAKARKVAASLPEFEQADEQALLDFAFDRYFSAGALLGSVPKCSRIVRRLAQIGVTEIACLLDFGLEDARIFEALPGIVKLREALAAGKDERV